MFAAADVRDVLDEMTDLDYGTRNRIAWAVVDRDSHELLIRTYVRHDGLLASPNVTKAMVKDRAALLSDRLREVVDDELNRAYLEDSKLAGWKGLRAADDALFRKVSGRGSR
jgi:hypothetical protein